MADTVRFQHFEVLRKEDGSLFELGRGAMGITYKAFDTNLRCHVALKVINAAYLNSEIARQRFLREARAAAALRHPNVATVFHLGSEDDNYFYAMEFIDGETVEGYMKREGAVAAPMALEIASQVSRALGAAQKQGLVHRDIKPSNLMFVHEDGGDDFTVKVIDFGLAKNADKDGEDSATLTAGGFLGTPHFASPEQLEEREIDVRSDIYSLGVTLWYMLAGKTPFSGSLAQVMSQHLHREPPFETLEGQAPAVVALLRHMMAKDPGDRPQTPAALRAEIEKCLDLVEAGPPAPPPRPAADDSFETTVMPGASEDSAVELSSGILLAERYRLIDEVTASDHGRVFRAQRLEDNAVVAVLILHTGKLATSEAFTRLEQEVEWLQKLRHSAFQKILSLENANHHTFLVLEWIEGTALLDVLRQRKALPLAEAKLLLAPLAEAFDELAAADLSCPDIAVHEVLLPGGNFSQPKFLPLTGAGARTISPDATMVASSFAMMKASGAFAGNPANAYVFAVASLAYEALGGVRAGSTMGSYVPIPGLSEAGNAALRKGLNPAQGYPDAKTFVAGLSSAAPASAASSSAAPAARPAPMRAPAPAPPTPPAPAVPAPKTPATQPAPPPPLPEQKPKKSLLPVFAIIAAVVVLLGGIGLWQGIVLMKRVKASQPPITQTDPTPTPAPDATPTPAASAEPTPAPDPRRVAYQDGLAAAEVLQKQDNIAAALAAYAALAAKFPEEKEAHIAMEMITAGLRARSAKMSPAELVALRPSLEQAAALNVRSAQMVLGESLIKSDPADALKWFLAAAAQGQSEAMVIGGKMLASGAGSGAPDLSGAADWFAKAADAGNSDGMLALGECLLYGKGVEKDPKRAIDVLTGAAALNNADALDMLGEAVYRRGVPGLIEPNFPEAFRLISRAKDLGSLSAQGNLGVLYINGEGVKQDAAMAASLFRDGAEKGNASCMFYYAMCFAGGRGVEQSEARAREWFVKAAQGGDKRAIDWCKKNNIPLANTP